MTTSFGVMVPLTVTSVGDPGEPTATFSCSVVPVPGVHVNDPAIDCGTVIVITGPNAVAETPTPCIVALLVIWEARPLAIQLRVSPTGCETSTGDPANALDASESARTSPGLTAPLRVTVVDVPPAAASIASASVVAGLSDGWPEIVTTGLVALLGPVATIPAAFNAVVLICVTNCVAMLARLSFSATVYERITGGPVRAFDVSASVRVSFCVMAPPNVIVVEVPRLRSSTSRL